ncbi:MAG: sodium:proton antiporter [Flavobacteriia bacterium]|nr:sodium:proton antiporter [Flavobacteriia bacterium]
MSETLIIIIICSLLLFAYIFDISAGKTKIPSVILLLILGVFAKYLSVQFKIEVPELKNTLPILGSLGLVLIVLEGSLDLELTSSKKKLIFKSVIVSLLPMFALAFLLAYVFQSFGNDFRSSIANAIPFCIISSAIAIPSVRNFTKKHREFIIYESSLSDIFGILFFNFIILNKIVDIYSVGIFLLQILIIVLVSLIAIFVLSVLLKNIKHHVKFLPIIILIVLIYDVSKLFHLPGLIFILLFGLFLGNIPKLKEFKWFQKIDLDKLNTEVHKFKEIVSEFTFLIRAVFFIIFGFLIEINDVLNSETLLWSGSIVATIFIFRGFQLFTVRLPNFPLLFIAPRGLITILLFLALDDSLKIDLVNSSLIIQVILLTAIILMFGNMIGGKKKNDLDDVEFHI